jgi:hypothetical protein
METTFTTVNFWAGYVLTGLLILSAGTLMYYAGRAFLRRFTPRTMPWNWDRYLGEPKRVSVQDQVNHGRPDSDI